MTAATFQTTFVTAGDFRAYVASRGYKTKAIMNTIAAAEGADLRVGGYELLGPRRSKTVVLTDAHGHLSLDSAKLFCDCCDYATAKIKAKRA